MDSKPDKPAEAEKPDGEDEEKYTERHLPDIVFVGTGMHRPWDLGPGVREHLGD